MYLQLVIFYLQKQIRFGLISESEQKQIKTKIILYLSIVDQAMEFTEFEQLQSFKQLLQADFKFSQFIINPEVNKISHEFKAILNDIQEINHSRSLSQSIIERENSIRKDSFCFSGMNLEELDTFHDEQITLTPPSKPMISQSKISTIFSSKKSNKQNLGKKTSPQKPGLIKVFYFGKPIFKFIQFSNKTNIQILIAKSLLAYSQDLSLDQSILSSKDPKMFEMRFPVDQGGCEPDFEVEPILHNRVVDETMIDTLILVKSKKERKRTGLTRQLQIIEILTEGQVKLHFFNQANIFITSLIISKSETLKKAVDFLKLELREKIVLFQSLESDMALPEDFDIANLSTYKIFAKRKQYVDEPNLEVKPLKLTALAQKQNPSTSAIIPIGITQASRYQEFQVVKINSRGVGQKRIIGFDQTKYYNYDPEIRKKKEQASIFSVFIGNNLLTGTKKPQRLICEIRQIKSLSENSFLLTFHDKSTQFKVESQLVKQKIIRKVGFLINFHRSINK